MSLEIERTKIYRLEGNKEFLNWETGKKYWKNSRL